MSDDPEPPVADLLGAVGHELRHTVGTLAHQLELLADPEAAEPLRRRSLAVLAMAAADLGRLTDRLADLESLARGELAPAPAVVDVAALVAEVAEVAEVAVAADGPEAGPAEPVPPGAAATARVTGEAEGPHTALADPGLVRRVLAALVGEVGAGGDGVTVEVRAGAGGDRIEVTAGPGEPPADPWPARPVAIGDGLGPWAAAELARRAGGDLAVGWPRRGGRRFRLDLPSPQADTSGPGGGKLGGDG